MTSAERSIEATQSSNRSPRIEELEKMNARGDLNLGRGGEADFSIIPIARMSVRNIERNRLPMAGEIELADLGTKK